MAREALLVGRRIIAAVLVGIANWPQISGEYFDKIPPVRESVRLIRTKTNSFPLDYSLCGGRFAKHAAFRKHEFLIKARNRSEE